MVQLLAFGDTREAVALVAALAEALAEHAAAIAQPGAARLRSLFDEANSAYALVNDLLGPDLLLKIEDTQACQKGFGSEEGSLSAAAMGGVFSGAAGERLAAVASVVLARLLPEMARLLQGLLQVVLQGQVEPKHELLGALRSDLSCFVFTFPWVAAAAARSTGLWGETEQQQRGTGSDDCSNGAGGNASDDTASWRQLLLVEMRLPALLGAALELLLERVSRREGRAAAAAVAGSSDIQEERYQNVLTWTLVVLATWVPAELGRVVAAADRAEAAGRPRGGHLPSTALLRAVLGPGGCRADPELLAAVEAACAGAGPRQVPTIIEPAICEPVVLCSAVLLSPTRARELTSD
ncbi:hypothetical protein GPECTOR_17g808 [Gonium pectorale]|uniref:Uncharacterized protein n=1 Tax=Gonium pectorale TaxID=33097 RepID=A0A150GK56_GONPE|nr:hypothetical protein GPECTOR_17g808 [Gonium pectorale]|eukprot:KXZ50172.1 hypothetical protein GPECTOR_17g808 [Gonium pectorale]